MTDEQRALGGNAGHRKAPVLGPWQPLSPDPVEVETFEPPEDLTEKEREVWLVSAPHAFAARTLTRGTVEAFKLLCRNVLIEKELAASPEDRGRTSHQGMIHKVETAYLRFNLSPCGKAMVSEKPKEKPANPLEKYLQHG